MHRIFELINGQFEPSNDRIILWPYIYNFLFVNPLKYD
jgi:hypothetical protein